MSLVQSNTCNVCSDNDEEVAHYLYFFPLAVPPIVTAGSGLEKQAVGYVKELVCNVKGYPQPDPRDITWTGPKQRPIKNEGRLVICG